MGVQSGEYGRFGSTIPLPAAECCCAIATRSTASRRRCSSRTLFPPPQPTGPASHAPDATTGERYRQRSNRCTPQRRKLSWNPNYEPQGHCRGREDEDRPIKLEWYILKVQSNREDSIRDGLLRRVQMAGLEKYFADVHRADRNRHGVQRGQKDGSSSASCIRATSSCAWRSTTTPGISSARRRASAISPARSAAPSPMAAAGCCQDSIAKTEEKTDESPQAEHSREERRPRQNQRRHLRELRRRSRQHQRSQRPRDCDHQHLRPADAGRIGTLAD